LKNVIESVKAPILKTPVKNKIRNIADERKQIKIIQEEKAKENEICIYCDDFIPSNLLYEFTYSQVILSHNRSKNNPDDLIPKIVKKVYPEITETKFIKMQTDTNWLKETVKVCQNCYLLLTDTYFQNINSKNRIIENKLVRAARAKSAQIKKNVRRKPIPDIFEAKFISNELIEKYKELTKLYKEDKNFRNNEDSGIFLCVKL